MMATRIALALALLAGAAGLLWYVHHVGYAAGQAEVKLANAEAVATVNAKAVEEWRLAAEAQTRADTARRAQDQAQDVATAAALRGIERKFAEFATRAPPPGRCDLSREWIRAYNEAR